MAKTPLSKRSFLKASAASAALGLMAPKALARRRAKARAPQLETLASGWQFREAEGGLFHPATVPGTVHTDLLANGLIEDPFYGMNELHLQWIDKRAWDYQTSFTLTAAQLRHGHIELEFLGLDTYADVYLNDVLLLSSDNMFRSWTIDIKRQVRAGKNLLRVHFKSPIAEGLKRLKALGFDPPAVDDWSEIGGIGNKKLSMLTRKAPYHYGWDWGPRFVTSGIWRPVQLRLWSGCRLVDLTIAQDALSTQEARLSAWFEISADGSGEAELSVSCPQDPRLGGTAVVRLKPGVHRYPLRFVVKQPQLWWTNGLGEPFLYSFEGRLESGGARDSKLRRTGLRTLRLVQDKDAHGTSFFIELNGVAVFMKGANHIPNDSFLPRVTPQIYAREIRAAAAAHMNMLRVWGGGVYEDDVFYDLCDEAGILVWQEFVFACTMYPGDAHFLDNVRAEARDNIRRLRHHACLALWVGNNEIDTAWQNDVPKGGWGWKQHYDAAERSELWQAYQALFYQILPQAVQEHDPGRFYWPSSPLAAWNGAAEVRHADLATPTQSGDIHYWGVWWGELPFSSYRSSIGRFMSEYGFQSFPEYKTVVAYAGAGEQSIFSPVMKDHQRSYIGNGTITTYMARDYVVPKDFRHFLYVGQVLQGEGVRVAMEAHRMHKPYCMGSLFWQLNDCWPVASWSSIDYYGRPKALQYFARKSFAPVLVSSWLAKDSVMIGVVSDRLEDQPVRLRLQLCDFSGVCLKEENLSFLLKANSAAIAYETPLARLLATAERTKVLLKATLSSETQLLAEDILYFSPTRELQLPAPTINWQVQQKPQGLSLSLTSSRLVKNLYLSLKQNEARFSDNYFDLLPHEMKEVMITGETPETLSGLTEELSLMHMQEVARASQAPPPAAELSGQRQAASGSAAPRR